MRALAGVILALRVAAGGSCDQLPPGDGGCTATLSVLSVRVSWTGELVASPGATGNVNVHATF
jgi:hypothetical protein